MIQQNFEVILLDTLGFTIHISIWISDSIEIQMKHALHFNILLFIC